MKNKRGSEKYYIIISLILGLMVLALGLYFIFAEFFNQDEIDWEVCRQSIILRAGLPEVSKFGISFVGFKDDFPLKCKTQVFEITKEDIVEDKAEKIIANTITQCWDIFGNGDFDIFPSEKYGITSYCVPCARIHLTNEAKEYLVAEPSMRIDIERGLNFVGVEGLSYKTYLSGIGAQFAPFTIGYGRDFYLDGDDFEVDKSDEISGSIQNRRTGAKEASSGWFIGTGFEFSKVSLPKYMDYEKGDLLINYGSLKSSSKEGVGANVPYLFYFQIGQKDDPFEETKNRIVDADSYLNNPITATFTGIWEPELCKNWDGIPA